MIAVFVRNGLKRHCSIHKQWQKRSTADSTGAPIIRSQLHDQQSKSYARFPQPNCRKTKKLDLSAPSIFTPLSSMASKIGLVSWYLGMVKSRPILTKSITSALIYTAADLSSQTITPSSSEAYNFLRTFRMAGYGMLIIGPSLHFWFNFVSKVFPTRDLITTLKKMVLGQTIYGPTITVVFFSVNAALQGTRNIALVFTLMSILCLGSASAIQEAHTLPRIYFAGENGVEIVARLKRDLLPTMMNGVMYWPICDFVTFKFIPVHLQPLMSNCFSYLWTVYMTYMASLEKIATT